MPLGLMSVTATLELAARSSIRRESMNPLTACFDAA